MKVTFPHMGNAYITLKVILEELGIEVIIPPKCNKNTLELGTKYSPETICLPFKINIGNFIEALEAGADTILMINGCGDICRLGMYSDIQENILKDLGYNFQMIKVRTMKSLKEIKDFFHVLKKLSGNKSYIHFLSAFRKGIKILNEVDELYDLMLKVHPIEKEKNKAIKLYKQFESDILKIKGYTSTLKLIKEYKNKIENIEVDKEKPILKVGIVGEIYTVIEPFVNLNIENKLGDLGVEVTRSLSNSIFMNHHLDFLPFIKSDRKKIHKAASPYLEKMIGGHTIETIGCSVLFSEKNYDGLIHLLPFGCMPEIVSKPILNNIEKDTNIPVLSLVLDELTGEGGYVTRLEAFIDLIKRRKEKIFHA